MPKDDPNKGIELRYCAKEDGKEAPYTCEAMEDCITGVLNKKRAYCMQDNRGLGQTCLSNDVCQKLDVNSECRLINSAYFECRCQEGFAEATGKCFSLTDESKDPKVGLPNDLPNTEGPTKERPKKVEPPKDETPKEDINCSPECDYEHVCVNTVCMEKAGLDVACESTLQCNFLDTNLECRDKTCQCKAGMKKNFLSLDCLNENACEALYYPCPKGQVCLVGLCFRNSENGIVFGTPIPYVKPKSIEESTPNPAVEEAKPSGGMGAIGWIMIALVVVCVIGGAAGGGYVYYKKRAGYESQ